MIQIEPRYTSIKEKFSKNTFISAYEYAKQDLEKLFGPNIFFLYGYEVEELNLLTFCLHVHDAVCEHVFTLKQLNSAFLNICADRFELFQVLTNTDRVYALCSHKPNEELTSGCGIILSEDLKDNNVYKFIPARPQPHANYANSFDDKFLYHCPHKNWPHCLYIVKNLTTAYMILFKLLIEKFFLVNKNNFLYHLKLLDKVYLKDTIIRNTVIKPSDYTFFYNNYYYQLVAEINGGVIIYSSILKKLISVIENIPEDNCPHVLGY